MVGHRALGLVERGRQLGDRRCPLEHQVQDGHPGLVPQRLELVRLIGHDVVGEVVVRGLVPRRERLCGNGRHPPNEPEMRSVCQATSRMTGRASLAALTTPVGRAHGAASSGARGAEGATSPESLRPTDRSGEATLESRRSAASPKGKVPLRTRRGGSDGREALRCRDSGGTNRTITGEEPTLPTRPTLAELEDHGEFARRHIGPDRGPAGRHAVDDRRGGPGRVARRRRPRPPSAPASPWLSRPGGPSGRSSPTCGSWPARNRGGDLAHRHGVLRHVHAAGHPAQPAREPGLVHGLHALPARDQPGPARGAPQLPDDGRRPDRHGSGQRLDAGRGDGGRRSHGDVPPAVEEPERDLRRASRHPSADDRRPADAGRAGRHRPRGR